MGKELTILQPTNPAQLPSLPAWLQRRSDALAAADKVRYQPVQNLPEAMILTAAEQAEVRRHIDQLEVFLRLDQLLVIRGQARPREQALGVMIAGLLIKSGQRLDEATSDAITDDYFDALDDIPAWCVREALRKWNRAESVQLDPRLPHDFRWAPKPPILRKLADHELATVKCRIHQLQRICDARPVVEFSAEHREKMINRISVLFGGSVQLKKIEDAA